MPLRIVQSPGCADVLTDEELGLEVGEILIDTGKIAEAIGYNPADENANRALLRVAARMRSMAIVAATEEGVNGIVRTSNRNPARVERLRELAGGAPVRTVEIDRNEACRRIRRLVPNDEARRAACELGLGRYFDHEN